jgi:hypothetical protein
VLCSWLCLELTAISVRKTSAKLATSFFHDMEQLLLVKWWPIKFVTKSGALVSLLLVAIGTYSCCCFCGIGQTSIFILLIGNYILFWAAVFVSDCNWKYITDLWFCVLLIIPLAIADEGFIISENKKQLRKFLRWWIPDMDEVQYIDKEE